MTSGANTGVGRRGRSDERGFTVTELLVSVGILMVVSALMMSGTMDMSQMTARQSNRSEMHAGIRNATALLQQEVGQAGRIALPASATLANAIATPGPQWTVISPSVAGIFVGEQLVIARGNQEEIVTVLDVNPPANRIRASFLTTHNAGSRVMPTGGFAEGIIPTTRANGSSASVLKIVGDINSDGNLMYVEYTCDWGAGRLYRNMMPYDIEAKPVLTTEQVLVDNLLPNPPDPDGAARPCFQYEERTINGITYVINVAIMTTVRTDERDPTTGQFQTVTKALLNVAPRNVFSVWQIASLNYRNRIQPLPPSVIDLLP